MKRILIVDDDQRTRRVLQILARKMDLSAETAAGADLGLACFRRERSDLVVTDLKMPEKDGLELLTELRAIDAEVPVIVLTAHGTVTTAVAAMKLGAVDFLQKPFDVDALELVIRRALDHSRLRLEHRFLREQAERAGPLRGPGRQLARDARRLRSRAPDRADPQSRPDHRRDRHRQGARRPRHSRAEPAPRASSSSP